MQIRSVVFDAWGAPYRTLNRSRYQTWSVEQLIRHAQENPPVPIIEGLLNKGDILLLHGSEESFKSIFVVQVGECIATGNSLLNLWRVPHPRTVGVVETEMHEAMMGERLAKMFPRGNPPGNLFFMGESALRDWRRATLADKFQFIQKWVDERGIEVLIIDTANDFFRGADNPSEERAVGRFFDELRSLNNGARIIVRHDRKRNTEQDDGFSSNERIRGSAEWKEDPEAILSLERTDRRTHEVELEVGKLRYGRKTEPLSLWFDAGAFRLTALPPVIAVLSQGEALREEIVAQAEQRFGLGERKVATMLAEMQPFLIEGQRGHARIFAIRAEQLEHATWGRFLR